MEPIVRNSEHVGPTALLIAQICYELNCAGVELPPTLKKWRSQMAAIQSWEIRQEALNVCPSDPVQSGSQTVGNIHDFL